MSFEQDEQQANTMEFAIPVNAAQMVDADVQIVTEDQQAMAEDPFVEEGVDTEDHLSPDTESDMLQWSKPPLLGKDTLNSIIRQFSPLLVPLPFAILVFLFTLPATLQGPPDHPAPAVMGLLLLALAILQGTLLYFAGSNDTLWVLCTVSGYVLFVTLGVGATFGWMLALILLIVLVALGIVPIRRGIHPIQEGYVDIVESFGKYAHTLYPGLNLLMPWEKVARRLHTQEITWTCDEQRVSISREQFVRLKATISYHLCPDDAHLAINLAQDWEQSLRLLFVGTLQSVVNTLTPADFVSWSQSLYLPTQGDDSSFNPSVATRWDSINEALGRRVQDQVAAWGVEITWVRIQDPTILPHVLDGQLARRESNPPPVSQPAPVAAVVPTPVTEKRSDTAAAAPTVAVPLASPPPPSKTPGNRAPKIETLVDAYNAVRENAITDPATILEIAQRFEQLAGDPEASKMLDFDAARAANTLRQRAQKVQERVSNAAVKMQHEG